MFLFMLKLHQQKAEVKFILTQDFLPAGLIFIIEPIVLIVLKTFLYVPKSKQKPPEPMSEG